MLSASVIKSHIVLLFMSSCVICILRSVIVHEDNYIYYIYMFVLSSG